jgi:hypothetical protein
MVACALLRFFLRRQAVWLQGSELNRLSGGYESPGAPFAFPAVDASQSGTRPDASIFFLIWWRGIASAAHDAAVRVSFE